MIIGVLAAAAVAGGDTVAKLGWMAGTWAEDSPSAVVREMWLPPLGGAMAGATVTTRPGKPPAIEHTRITAEPAGVTFTALLDGQPPTAFVLVPGGEGEAVFENKAHDFPQRVIYRRCGEQLCARIEGVVRGELKAKEWRYSRISP